MGQRDVLEFYKFGQRADGMWILAIHLIAKQQQRFQVVQFRERHGYSSGERITREIQNFEQRKISNGGRYTQCETVISQQ